MTIVAASSPSAESGLLQPTALQLINEEDQMDGRGLTDRSLGASLPAKKLSKVWLDHEPKNGHSTEPLSL
jgi:hypothetical protein